MNKTILTVRCWAFTSDSGPANHRVCVEDGVVRVWDPIAQYYTLCHRLSRRTEARIAALAVPKTTLGQLADVLAFDHISDPLVGENVAASDADDFDDVILGKALREQGYNSSEQNVQQLRELLRRSLALAAAW